MKPLNNYLIKSFERANLEQIADTYREKGYSIKTDARIGPYRVDIVAIKGDETIYIELKTHTERPEAKHRIKEMADYFKTIPNAKFIVAISRIPEFKTIVFDGIEGVLYNFLTTELPSDLDALSTHTMIDSVSDINISLINIKDGLLYIICNGILGTILQYGANSEQEDNEETIYMSFPFKFKGSIGFEDGHYYVQECNKLTIDTDAYYE